MYTISGSSRGNKALTNPVGLITADEVSMAGGVYGDINKSYYLYTGQQYWTMSPYLFPTTNSHVHVFVVWLDGYLSGSPVLYTFGVRPVINIASDVEITGSGTSADPYVVVGAEG